MHYPPKKNKTSNRKTTNTSLRITWNVPPLFWNKKLWSPRSWGHSNHMGPLGKGQAQHSTSDTQIHGSLVTPIQLINIIVKHPRIEMICLFSWSFLVCILSLATTVVPFHGATSPAKIVCKDEDVEKAHQCWPASCDQFMSKPSQTKFAERVNQFYTPEI